MNTITQDYYLTPHFRIFELMCKDSYSNINTFPRVNKNIINFLFALEEFRVWYNKPMNINSCFRSEEVNDRVGGSVKSNHLTATAIDWDVSTIIYGMSPERLKQFRENVIRKWLELGEKYGYFVEVEINSTWIHLSFNTNADRNINRIGRNRVSNVAGSNLKKYFSRKATQVSYNYNL